MSRCLLHLLLACCRQKHLAWAPVLYENYINHYGSWNFGDHTSYRARSAGLVNHEIDTVIRTVYDVEHKAVMYNYGEGGYSSSISRLGKKDLASQDRVNIESKNNWKLLQLVERSS